MTDRKISELTNITGANLADDDEFVVVDTSVDETKAITYGELKNFNGTLTSGGLTVDTNTLHVDSTNNRVGIGTTSPSAPIEAVGSVDILQLTGTTGNAFARFTDSDASSDFSIGADDGSGAGAGAFVLYDRNNSAYRLVLDSSGHAIIPAGVTLGTSAGTYVAANTLDAYEEGTHQTAVTMSTSGTVTLNTSYDRFSYTKIGRLVTITGHPRIASVSSPVGSISLTLPFAAASGQVDECRTGGVMRYYDNSAGAGSYNRPVAWSIQENSSTLAVDNINTNGNNFTPAASDEFYFSISYITA